MAWRINTGNTHMMLSLRNARVGTSYLQGLVLDVLLPFQTNDAASRLLGLQANTLRAQYSAAMLPLAFPYLSTTAYDYSPPTMRATAETKAQPEALSPTLRQSTSTSQAIQTVTEPLQSHSNVMVSRNLNSPLSGDDTGNPRTLAKELRQADPSLQLQSPRQHVSELDLASAKDRAAPQAPDPKKFSLADLGHALEAHNFPGLAGPKAATADELPKSVPAQRVNHELTTKGAMPRHTVSMADIVIPSLPPAHSSHPSTSNAANQSMVAAANVFAGPTSEFAQRVLSPRNSVKSQIFALNLPASEESAVHTTASRPTTPTAASAAVPTTQAPKAIYAPPPTASLQRFASRRDVSPLAPAETSHKPSQPRRRIERPTTFVASRSRPVQRLPVAFLERSQLAHMRLRLFR